MTQRKQRWWASFPIIVFCGGLLITGDRIVRVDAQTRPPVTAPKSDTARPALSIAKQLTGPDSIYRLAREAMVKGNTSQAINLFGSLASRYPRSSQAPSALYYRAFLQYQQYQPSSAEKPGNPVVLKLALVTINQLEKQHPRSRQARDAITLKTRICGELGKLGDKACREQVVVAAQRPVPEMRAGDTSGQQRYFLFAPETPSVGPGRFFGMNTPNKTRLIPIDTTCRRQRELGEYVAALNSLWKLDTLKAMENTVEVLGMRNSCLARVRETAMLMLIQRPAPIQGMAPTVFEVARNDPDWDVKQLATAWLLSQEWDPQVARFLHATFGQAFKTKSPR